MNVYLRGGLVLLAVWGIAVGTVWSLRAARPSPEKFQAYLARNSLESLGEGRRAEVIAQAASQLNRLTFEQRQELRDTGSVRTFFEQLTPAERDRFLDLTLPEGFRQLMDALNKMDPEKRGKLVERILEGIRKSNPESAARLDEAGVRKIISQGLSSFYREADADVKLDFAPVVEELQRSIQSLR